MARRTTITIFDTTKTMLDKFGRKNESYDELLQRLIKELDVVKDR